MIQEKLTSEPCLAMYAEKGLPGIIHPLLLLDNCSLQSKHMAASLVDSKK